MKSKTRLDSAIFQLTPTRTRCDLYVIANDKKEKIASGLLNPFLAHLKTAQDQIAKGGYSVLLEPDPGSNASWFTKGTLERFVRFVSTPEILERLYTIESEILQIQEAISVQAKNDITLEDNQVKPLSNNEHHPQKERGYKPMPDANEEKAIVLYTPGAQTPAIEGSNEQEKNSKIQLLKVLEARKTTLQKEQGMAFARAVAAGYEYDNMAPLVAFAECFGASRLMEACLRFIDVWKGKHDSGQWLDVDTAEAIPSKTDFTAMNASGIMLSSMASQQHNSLNALASENHEKKGVDRDVDGKSHMDHQIPLGQQEYIHGNIPHSMFPSWPTQSSPSGVPFFPPYPMQGMPYYQKFPGHGPFYPPPYPPMEDSRFNAGHRTGRRRQSMDSIDTNPGPESLEIDASRMRSHDESEFENQSSHHERHKKPGRSGEKQSGVVVIRNINYITSKKDNSSGDDSESPSDSKSETRTAELQDKQNSGLRSSRKGYKAMSVDESNACGKNDRVNGKEEDGGDWQAFQSYLLREPDEDNRSTSEGIFAPERDMQRKRRQNAMGDDPLALSGRGQSKKDLRVDELHKISGNVSPLQRASDEIMASKVDGDYGNGGLRRIDIHSTERYGRKITYKSANDDFMVSGQNQFNLRNSFDPLVGGGVEGFRNDLVRSASDDLVDETYIVPFRSMSLDQNKDFERTAMGMDHENPSSCQISNNSFNRAVNQVNYEPHDLSLMPERGSEKRSVGYDPALEYEMQFSAWDAAIHDKTSADAVIAVKQGYKNAEKVVRSKTSHDSVGKWKSGGPVRKGKPSKLNPLEDARARAEKLRSFKADLQKMKKEQEDAQKKRLEALKVERQKRIAARGNTTSVRTTFPSQKQLPTKLSPMSHRGSKFSDSEPGSSSPLQRSKIRTTSIGSSEPTKPAKGLKSSDASRSAGSRLTRSVSSLSETKKEINGATPDSKASMSRIRRLSEPKKISHPPTLVKTQSLEQVSKPKLYNGPESNKISAIINLDRSKAATLPELKIKPARTNSNVGLENSSEKETLAKLNEEKPTLASKSAELNHNSDKLLHHTDIDDNPIIDKTIVILEREKSSTAVLNSSEELIGIGSKINGNHEAGVKIESLDYAVTGAVTSHMDGINRRHIPNRSYDPPSSYEATTNTVDMGMPKVSTTIAAEKPYQAPYARVSSLEDPATRNSEYGKAPPTNFETVTAGAASAKAHVSDFDTLKLEKIPEVLEKPHVKELKGFRRLLKLGKKSHSSAANELSIDSDSASIDGNNAINSSATHEVNTLKNLISQDETETSGTDNSSLKSSRHFSILSPFKIKTSEKKPAT